MEKINTTRLQKKQKQKERSHKKYGTQKHIRLQEEIRMKKREKEKSSK